MRTVQLDKNAGGKKLREYCNQDGAVECFLLPPAVRDAEDADVADFGVRHGNLTLTFGKGFMLNAAPRIVGINPGILPMRTDDNSFEQVSTKTAPKMLRAFKEQFPEWHEVP